MSIRRMPAEWEIHETTWLAWPHEESDWPGKLDSAREAYREIISTIARFERVEVLLSPEDDEPPIKGKFPIRYHRLETDRSWLRDSAPTCVIVDDVPQWVAWKFNAWAKYGNFLQDQKVPAAVAELSELQLECAKRPDDNTPLVLEGGAIESDGQGTLLVTEECLLSSVQERNASLGRLDYEKAFATYLGVSQTIWLDRGVEGDDTHGHIDDIARFSRPGRVLLALEEREGESYFSAGRENLARVRASSDAKSNSIEVIPLPLPESIEYQGERLPASYANFYILNGAVLVPTFRDAADAEAMSIIKSEFPEREVISIDCRELIIGQGALHCLTQPQFRGVPV